MNAQPDLFAKQTGHKIILFGYGGRTSVNTLRKLAINYDAIVIDTRFAPHTQNDWRKSKLLEILGNRYRHAKSLGNENYRERIPGTILLHNPDIGIPKLIEYIKQGNVILMCVCRKISVGCHRNEILRLLAEYNKGNNQFKYEVVEI